MTSPELERNSLLRLTGDIFIIIMFTSEHQYTLFYDASQQTQKLGGPKVGTVQKSIQSDYWNYMSFLIAYFEGSYGAQSMTFFLYLWHVGHINHNFTSVSYCGPADSS